MKNISLTILALSIAPVTYAAIATGDVISVDFGTGGTSTNYNVITDTTTSIADLGRLSDGAATGVSLTTTADVYFMGVGYIASTDTGLVLSDKINTTDSTVYSDGLVSNLSGAADTITLTFSGLDDNLTYDLVGGLSRGSSPENFATTWAVGGVSQSTDGSAAGGYVEFTGLLTTSPGTLLITLTNATTNMHAAVAQLSLIAGAAVVDPAIELGDEIRVDFGTTIAAGNCNVINSGALSIADMIRYSDGANVQVGLSVSATTPFDNSGNIASTSGLANIDISDLDVYGDGFLSANGSNGGGNDIITLTFTGLDDSLYYDLVGGLSRSSGESNFTTSWAVAGAELQVGDGSAANGYVAFSSLESSGGTLVVTLTDTVRQSGLAQLSLIATDTPPPEPPLPPAPELPAPEVAVYFGPTEADADATVDDINYMTIGGTWAVDLPATSAFLTDPHTGKILYVMEGSSAQGDYLELTLDGNGLNFSSNDVAINFDMLATRAVAGTDKHTTLIGYDGTDEIFRLKYVSHSTNANNIITATTGDGDESMGFTPLRLINYPTIPSGLQDFRILLSGGQVFFSGSSLTAQDGPVLNSTQRLTRLRWEITGSNADFQGFWLHDLQVRDGLPSAPRAATDRPNVIFMLTDDMGYSDLSCYGSGRMDTTNLDALAADGLQFTNFVLPGNVCSPTRASFLTGAYPSRCGMPMAVNDPNQNHWFLGLDPDEITIAEQVRQRGYKTSMVGKWHLGVEDIFLPHNQGFDHYLGTWGNGGSVYDESELAFASFPENRLTSIYTHRIREHIRQYRDRPFFIYYPHNYPHLPFTEGNAFTNSSGVSGGERVRHDVLKEMDWSVGQIIAELEANGLLENTLIIFSSDNGAVPPDSYANAPFKGSKYVVWEGGHRVPFIMYWKGQVLTPGVIADTQVWAMDVFPTISELAGASMPTDRVYDGTSLVPLLTDQAIARAADAPFYYYSGDNLQCVRKGDWKLHLPRTEYQLPWWDQIKPPPSTYQLYDLSTDPGETIDVSAANPAIVAELTALADAIRLELGDADPDDGSLVMGSGQRGTGTLFPEVPTIVNLNSDYSYVPDWNSLSDAEKGRGKTLEGQEDISAAHVFINGTVLPVGWQYLNSDAATGGNEVAMAAGVVVGTQGNIGFAGTGTAAVIGNASTGTYVIDSGNSGNSAVAGTDLLISTDDGASSGYVIVRYTIEEHDIAIGKTRATITGNFRDLVGGTSDDSVVVHVYHNSTELFTETGAAGRLTQANGSFAISGLSVAAGDTISFVVGNNGTSVGDEVALSASIEFQRETSVSTGGLALGIQTGTSGVDGFARLQFQGTPSLSYQVEKTTDLADSESWRVVDVLPFLPASPHDVYVETVDDRGFWRMTWTGAE